jgi:molybdopterin-guanine dinucleotide biosynthesis protein A
LSGVAAGLRWAAELERFGLLVLACDLPLVSAALLKEIRALATSEVDAVVPDSATEGTQPLCAWYGPGALPTVEARLEGGEYSMRGLLAHIRVGYVPVLDDILNVNTRAELTVARRHVSTEGPG